MIRSSCSRHKIRKDSRNLLNAVCSAQALFCLLGWLGFFLFCFVGFFFAPPILGHREKCVSCWKEALKTGIALET